MKLPEKVKQEGERIYYANQRFKRLRTISISLISTSIASLVGFAITGWTVFGALTALSGASLMYIGIVLMSPDR